jgi:tyrosyl-tRNA synthetase
MQFKLAPDLIERFPDFGVAFVVAMNLRNEGTDESIAADLHAQCGVVRESLAGKDVAAEPAVAVWREAFGHAGIDPDAFPSSIESLLRRVSQGEDIPSISKAVDLANIVSLRYCVPVGAHDLARLRGDFVVRIADDRDVFTPLGQRDCERVPAGEVVYADDLEVRTRRWVWRLGERAKVTQASRAIFFPIDGFRGQTESQARAAAAELAVLLARRLGATVATGFVSVCAPAAAMPDVSAAALDPVERLLTRRVVDVLPTRESFETVLRSGRKIRIYIGVDATSPVIHIGHSVPIQKLREFQDLGHKVILLIGDFTGRIGDPTDKSAARVQLTPEMVAENAQTYVDQVSKILDFGSKENPVELRFNSEWWEQKTGREMIEMAASFTVQQMLQREMYQKRLAENRPIGLHEFLYPLLQGYDSVAMDVDAELGGTDQTFNILAGRTLLKAMRNKEKYVLTCPLLEGVDGRKMSKSYGNVIGVSDEPYDMYGKTMSLRDDLIVRYFELVTDVPDDEIDQMTRDVALGVVNPMALKKRLAEHLVTRFHSAEAAREAGDRFLREVQQREIPAEMPLVVLERGGEWAIVDLLVQAKLATGRNDAKRLIEGGSVQVDGEKVTDARASIAVRDGMVLRGRRRQFARLGVGEPE